MPAELTQDIIWLVDDAVVFQLVLLLSLSCYKKLFSTVCKNKKARHFCRALLYEWVSKYREINFPSQY
jgi:hypothetical protein